MAAGRMGLAALGAALALGAWPCDLDHGKARPVSAGKALTPPWVGPAHSGSWFTASRSGEGFVLQVLDDGSALMVWFTFPPAGSPGTQAWVIASGGRIDGDRIRFTQALTTRGARFGAGFDPLQVRSTPWGTIEFRFLDCNRAEVTFEGPAAWGSGTREVTRLTSIAELGCGPKAQVNSSGARTMAGLKQRSASWFDPAHNGEGWMLEELPDGRMLVYWFTYDDAGEQAWTVGISAPGTSRYEVASMLQPVGTRFGSAFDSSAIRNVAWGALTLDFSSCDAGTLDYSSTIPAFGSGRLRPVRIARLSGTACLDAKPSVPANAAWSKVAPMPRPQSEMGVARLGTRTCAVGGFGAPRGFACYDPVADAWTQLADLPDDRDHPVALVIEGALHLAGGYRTTGFGDVLTPGWRYVEAEDRWQAMPQLPNPAASGGAMLGGYAYFGDVSGSMFQYNPRTGTTRRLPNDGRERGDHSQLVAFQGELWLMGGRGIVTPDSNVVAIWDPASESWRDGPPLRFVRGGFAAAASESMVIVTAGEVIISGRRIVAQTEAIAAGDVAWTQLPTLLTAVHGVGGVLDGNRFILPGGSTLAGGVRNPGDVQVLRWTP